MTGIDPISRDVFQHQVHGIAEEMSMALQARCLFLDHLGHVRLRLRALYAGGRHALAGRDHSRPARHHVDGDPLHVREDTAPRNGSRVT